MGTKPALTEAQKSRIWQLRRAGTALSKIAEQVGCSTSAVWRVLAERGGVAPYRRLETTRGLRPDQREEISRGTLAGLSYRQIARQIGCAPSTVSREIRRNGGAETYRAVRAGQRAREQARRPKADKLSTQPRLRMVVVAMLEDKWAPQQIASRLKIEFAGEADMQISHETIYRSLFIQARGTLKKELVERYLRSRRSSRRGRQLVRKYESIPDAVSIRERPAEVEDRAVPGHWEGDLIVGSNGSHILTLVERHTRFAMLGALPNKEADTVVATLTRLIKRLPAELAKTLTWDRGTEMAHHKKFTMATNVQVYFCDPQSPWQRGSNENTNGLLRQYFPKGTDLSIHSQATLDKVARQLNGRPRETLGWLKPAEKLDQVLH
jgi:IS30 family transposase